MWSGSIRIGTYSSLTKPLWALFGLEICLSPVNRSRAWKQLDLYSVHSEPFDRLKVRLVELHSVHSELAELHFKSRFPVNFVSLRLSGSDRLKSVIKDRVHQT